MAEPLRDLLGVLAAPAMLHAIVQGGLSTTMELVAAGGPFVVFPPASPFEQRFHAGDAADHPADVGEPGVGPGHPGLRGASSSMSPASVMAARQATNTRAS